MLEARDISYTYPSTDEPALRNLDLPINGGERLAIVGANGAGKSTLLLILNGTLKPSTGGVFLNTAPVSYARKGLDHLRSHVGLVLQDPDDQIFAPTVFEDVSFGPCNQGLSDDGVRQRVVHALTRLNITDLSARAPHTLSFGQRKRVALAGALAMRPNFLLLDEPTAGLDPEGREHLVDTLNGLANDGLTVVSATHDLDFAYGWSDRVVVLAHGAVSQIGPPTTVFRDEASLRGAGLRAPQLFSVWQSLQKAGRIDTKTAPPRSLAELDRILERNRIA